MLVTELEEIEVLQKALAPASIASPKSLSPKSKSQKELIP